jgi:superfamily I DNA/RNA helicase
MNIDLILGGPGCGKTTALLEVVATEMETVPADRIAFVAFTTAAANEAKARAAKQFALNPEKDLPHFRTIHSMAYREMGVMRDEVMQRKDWQSFSDVVGYRVSGYSDINGDPGGMGDRMLQTFELARAQQRNLREAWTDGDAELDWYGLERFAGTYGQFKRENGKVDFTDMLEMYAARGAPLARVRVAVIDEAQDLTPLQWEVVFKAFAHVERMYIGGDDDQAIYQWAGADVRRFLALRAQRRVLPESHRLPDPVWRLSQELAKRISHRYEKPFTSTGRAGIVKFYRRPDQVDIERKGSWLILARNNYMLKELETIIRNAGHLYKTRRGRSAVSAHVRAIYAYEALRAGKAVAPEEAMAVLKFLGRPARLAPGMTYDAKALKLPASMAIWHEALDGIPAHDRWYYVAALRRGENLKREPHIRIETIHGVKGAEADHVMLLTDLSERTMRGFQKDQDPEHRVFYVGVTRARQSLHIIEPQTIRHYSI